MPVQEPIRDAFGFVGNGGEDPGALVGGMGQVTGVRFATTILGSYDVLVAIEATDLSGLLIVAAAVQNAGARDVAWSVPAPETVAVLMPKRRRTLFAAFVRFPAQRITEVIGAMDTQFLSLNDEDGWGYGRAAVSGKGYDILVDLGAPSEQETLDLVFGLRGVQGVDTTETSLASLEDAFFAHQDS